MHKFPDSKWERVCPAPSVTNVYWYTNTIIPSITNYWFPFAPTNNLILVNTYCVEAP